MQAGWAGSLAFRTAGPAHAPWLVLCHGMALDHRDLIDLAGAFSDRWRVLLWDMPGHGASQPAPGDWSLPAMAEALGRVMAAAGVDQPVLLGFSYGGMVAQAFARANPGAVRGLIAYGCFAPFHAPPPVPGAAIDALVDSLWGPLDWEIVRARFAERCALTLTGQAHVRAAMEAVGRAGFLAMSGSLLRGFQPDPAFRLDCPLLLLSGAEDSNGALLEQSQQALLKVHPQAKRVHIPDAGHCAHLDQPAAVRQTVTDFLETLQP